MGTDVMPSFTASRYMVFNLLLEQQSDRGDPAEKFVPPVAHGEQHLRASSLFSKSCGSPAGKTPWPL